MEIWKDIEGYEGKYQVSNMGRIKSLKDRYGNYREKILKPRENGYNYLMVVLYKNGKGKSYKVHRLVAEVFLPKIEGKTHVDHIDGNRQNNNVENLRWCSQAENNQFDLARKHKSESHKGEKNNMYGKTGELNHRSKIVICIELNKIYGSTREAEKELKIDQSNISKCCNGKQKSAGGYTWKYIDLLHCYN